MKSSFIRIDSAHTCDIRSDGFKGTGSSGLSYLLWPFIRKFCFYYSFSNLEYYSTTYINHDGKTRDSNTLFERFKYQILNVMLTKINFNNFDPLRKKKKTKQNPIPPLRFCIKKIFKNNST